jgi:hypothetical protein
MHRIRRMNADIPGFHQELLLSADVILFTLEDNENLFRGMAMERENATGRIFNKTEQRILARYHMAL